MTSKHLVPVDLFYTDNHTWVLVEDLTGTVGMSDFAQQEMAEIVYLELPEVGEEVAQGAAFGTIEAMKTVAELISPVTGKVIEVNEELIEHPRIINTDPYDDGWMIRVELSDPEEIDSIMTPDDYIAYISEE